MFSGTVDCINIEQQVTQKERLAWSIITEITVLYLYLAEDHSAAQLLEERRFKDQV